MYSSVPARLVVILDQLLAGIGGVGVDAEGGDPERAADRSPVDAGDGDLLQLVDAQDSCYLAGLPADVDPTTTAARIPRLEPLRPFAAYLCVRGPRSGPRQIRRLDVAVALPRLLFDAHAGCARTAA